MARHTIGNKRGSVRGAPPDVYMGFLSVDGDGDGPDPFEEPVRLFGQFIAGLAFLSFVTFVFVALWAVGIIPDEFADDY